MINRQDLTQLERDAMKEGAWQAKLAYAAYLLEFDESKKEDAKGYLNEVINAGVLEYSHYAKYLSLQYVELPNMVMLKTLVKELDSRARVRGGPHSSIYSNDHKNSPEFQYKEARCGYDIHINSRDKMVTTLKNLLSHREMTDTLRAKIYFQLVRINIEQAKEKGQRVYLEEAKKYCSLLTNDPALKSMSKAKEAEVIYKKIQSTPDKPIPNFSTHMKEAYDAGREGSRMFFKYTGIIIGNIIDHALVILPKLVIGKFFENNYIHKSTTKPGEDYFKSTGLASPFKFLGKLFGKHIVGNLISPITALTGLVTYPFQYLYNKYKTDTTITDLADTVIALPKGNHSKTDKQMNNLSTLYLRQIFGHKENDHGYGNIRSFSELKNDIKIVGTEYISRKEEGSFYGYGRVFGNAKKMGQAPCSGSQVPSPIYPPTI